MTALPNTFANYQGWEADFERLAPYLGEALAYTGGSHTLQDVRRRVSDGSFQLWPAASSVIITELFVAPTGQKYVNFFLAGGNLRELKLMHPIVCQWARTQGCTKATFAGRKGWERTFLTKEEGWKPQLVLYDKDL